MQVSDLSLVLSTPLLQTAAVALVGALAIQLVPRQHARRRLAARIVVFCLLSVLLAIHGIEPYRPASSAASSMERTFAGLVRTIWWLSGAWTLAGAARVLLNPNGHPRHGRLAQDLVTGVIYVGAALLIVSNVFDIPVGTLVATSGVVAIILGLALQSTLGDVFSGIALNLGRPYDIGHRLELGNGIAGRVVETNWRATHLVSDSNDLIIVPNSDMAKARITNLSSFESSHGVTLTIRIANTVSPAAMIETMMTALKSSNQIELRPEPGVQIVAMDSQAVALELWFRVASVGAAGAAKNEVFDLAYRHAKASGLTLAHPAGSILQVGPTDSNTHRIEKDGAPARLLAAVPLFAALSEEERDALAETMTRRDYRKGEVLIEQGEISTALMIVRQGAIGVMRHEDGCDLELMRLAPGDCFGERGLLTHESEFGTIRALTYAVTYEIVQKGFAEILRMRPAIADELGAVLAIRTDREKRLFSKVAISPDTNSMQRLAARIRHLFDIPHM